MAPQRRFPKVSVDRSDFREPAIFQEVILSDLASRRLPSLRLGIRPESRSSLRALIVIESLHPMHNQALVEALQREILPRCSAVV